jgi:hypothetical protein
MAANAPNRSNRHAHVALKHIPLEPVQTPSSSTSVSAKKRNPSNMANNADLDYVEELDVDQELRARHQASKSQPKAPVYMPQQPGRSGASSSGGDSDNEDAPLLSPTAQNYGSANGNGRRSSEYEWSGEADFAGLSWWNRPSVGALHCSRIQSGLMLIDLLASPTVSPVHHCFWWCHNTQG